MQIHIQLNEIKWRTYALGNKAIIGFQEVAILFQPGYKWELMISCVDRLQLNTCQS